MVSEYKRPLPDVNEDNRQFWEGARRHELLLQRCGQCGETRTGSPICPSCTSLDNEWIEASGRGKVYSWVVVHQRFHFAFEANLPYNVAVVELEEGPRLLTNLVDVEKEEIRLDMQVEVVWDDVTEEVTLPKFRPIG